MDCQQIPQLPRVHDILEIGDPQVGVMTHADSCRLRRVLLQPRQRREERIVRVRAGSEGLGVALVLTACW